MMEEFMGLVVILGIAGVVISLVMRKRENAVGKNSKTILFVSIALIVVCCIVAAVTAPKEQKVGPSTNSSQSVSSELQSKANTQSDVPSATNAITSSIPALSDTPDIDIPSSPEVDEHSFDLLQKLFTLVSSDFSIEQLQKYVLENNLYHTISEKDEVTYKVAYTESSALQKYADSGDYIMMRFDDTGKIMIAEYCNSKAAGYTALFYNYGTWWGFSNTNAKDYSGYYIDDSFGNNLGIVIEYQNGNKVESNYFPCDSSEEAIRKVLDKIREK